MNWTPKQILQPIALALVAVFYLLVNRSSDSQRGATWIFDRFDNSQIPIHYKARLKLELIYDETDTPPKRRASDQERSADA